MLLGILCASLLGKMLAGEGMNRVGERLKGLLMVAERFIRTLKNKIYEHTTAVSKNVYVDKLDDIVNEYNNTYPRTVNMKPAVLKITHILTLVNKLIIKIVNLKLVIM